MKFKKRENADVVFCVIEYSLVSKDHAQFLRVPQAPLSDGMLWVITDREYISLTKVGLIRP